VAASADVTIVRGGTTQITATSTGVTIPNVLTAGGTTFPSATGTTGQVLALSSAGAAAWSAVPAATSIANGTSNVTVASSGDITLARGGTTRLTVSSTGATINGALSMRGGGGMVFHSAEPESGLAAGDYTLSDYSYVATYDGSSWRYLYPSCPVVEVNNWPQGAILEGRYAKSLEGRDVLDLRTTDSLIRVREIMRETSYFKAPAMIVDGKQ